MGHSGETNKQNTSKPLKLNNCSVYLRIKNAFNTSVFYTKILVKILRSAENKFKILIENAKKNTLD